MGDVRSRVGALIVREEGPKFSEAAWPGLSCLASPTQETVSEAQCVSSQAHGVGQLFGLCSRYLPFIFLATGFSTPEPCGLWAVFPGVGVTVHRLSSVGGVIFGTLSILLSFLQVWRTSLRTPGIARKAHPGLKHEPPGAELTHNCLGFIPGAAV